MWILAAIAFIIAAFLEFSGGHSKPVIWLLIVGGLLLVAEVAWGWNRTGRYGRRPQA